jgi:hypothetical protein
LYTTIAQEWPGLGIHPEILVEVVQIVVLPLVVDVVPGIVVDVVVVLVHLLPT